MVMLFQPAEGKTQLPQAQVAASPHTCPWDASGVINTCLQVFTLLTLSELYSTVVDVCTIERRVRGSLQGYGGFIHISSAIFNCTAQGVFGNM